MERLTYVTEKGEILFHPEDLPDDEGMTIRQLAIHGRTWDTGETSAQSRRYSLHVKLYV